MKVLGTHPDEHRTFWPDYPDDKHTAYGYTGNPIRAPAPQAAEVSLMDDILNLVHLAPNALQRRVLNARALVHPLNGRHLYSWMRIATLIHSDYYGVKTIHKRGLSMVVARAPQSIVVRARAIILLDEN
jgi:hypothetical protein